MGYLGNTKLCQSIVHQESRDGTLAAYDYELKHKAGVENIANGLSRLPLHTEISSYILEDIETIFFVMENSFVNVNDVKRETLTDECFMKVYDFCLNGWPDECVQEELRPFKNKKLSNGNASILTLPNHF